MSLGETSYGGDISPQIGPGALTLGQNAFGWIEGTGGPSGDLDRYKTYLQAGTSYTLHVSGVGINLVPELSKAHVDVFDGLGTYILSLAPNQDGDINWNFTASSSGPHYFEVSGYTASDVGGYGIILYTAPDDHGGNLIGEGPIPGATPLTNGVTAFGNIERPADVDAFSFNAATGVRYFWSFSTTVPDLFVTIDNAAY